VGNSQLENPQPLAPSCEGIPRKSSVICHPVRQVTDTIPMQRSLTPGNSDITVTIQKTQKVKLWQMHQNCYVMHTVPNLL
jgi:hypothetical protein